MKEEVRTSIETKLNELQMLYLTVENSLSSAQARLDLQQTYQNFVAYVKLYLQNN